ncbi:MAG: lipoprotein-releasing ABC transporter permease subunit [Pseudomonadota bacterium]
MLRPLGFAIGLRYGLARRSFVAQVSALSVFGLALSTGVLLLVLSVINGFERELTQRILGIVPHLNVRARIPVAERAEDRAALESIAGVRGAASIVQGAVLIATAGEVRSVALNGIRGSEYAGLSRLDEFLSPGALERLQQTPFGLILGAALAREIGVEPGGRVTLIVPEGTVSPFGLHPRQRRFEVVGILDSASELDRGNAYTDIESAARLFRLGGAIHGYQLWLDDLFAAESTGRAAQAAVGTEFFASSWMRTHGTLYQAIGLQKVTMFVLLSLLVAVAAFNLVSTLVMVVNQRRADVAVLRTLGSSSGVVMLAFLTLGLVIGLLGVALGIALGIGLGALLRDGVQVLDSLLHLELLNQYFVTELPVELRLADIWLVGGTALAMCLVAALYPAWRAARLLPTAVLKYE